MLTTIQIHKEKLVRINLHSEKKDFFRLRDNKEKFIFPEKTNSQK